MKKMSDFIKTKYSKKEVQSDLLNNIEIKNFILKNKIPPEIVEKSTTNFMRFNNEINNCVNCKKIDDCVMVIKGYQPKLVYNKRIQLDFQECKYSQKNKFHKQSDLNSDIISFDTNEERKKVASYIKKYLEGNNTKGLYLHGKPGIGKTRILTVLANKAASKKTVKYINYPDFVRKIKDTFTNNTLEKTVENLKKVDLLILDDFGDEGIQSDWYRDQVLMPILQYRMDHNKTVFFGSNYTIDHLEKSFSSRVADSVKVVRLMERIRNLSKSLELNGKNWRN